LLRKLIEVPLEGFKRPRLTETVRSARLVEQVRDLQRGNRRSAIVEILANFEERLAKQRCRGRSVKELKCARQRRARSKSSKQLTELDPQPYYWTRRHLE